LLDGWLNSGNAVFWRSNLWNFLGKLYNIFPCGFLVLAQVVKIMAMSGAVEMDTGYLRRRLCATACGLRKLSIYCSPRLRMYSLELQSDASFTPALPHF
jgi:hypothetical protein